MNNKSKQMKKGRRGKEGRRRRRRKEGVNNGNKAGVKDSTDILTLANSVSSE
jgi:hypothetical protein